MPGDQRYIETLLHICPWQEEWKCTNPISQCSFCFNPSLLLLFPFVTHNPRDQVPPGKSSAQPHTIIKQSRIPKVHQLCLCCFLHPRTVCIMKYATGWKSYLPVTPQTNSKDSGQNWWANIYYQRPTTIYSRKLGSNFKTSAKSNQTCLWSLASVVTDVTQRSSTSVVWQLKEKELLGKLLFHRALKIQ